MKKINAKNLLIELHKEDRSADVYDKALDLFASRGASYAFAKSGKIFVSSDRPIQLSGGMDTLRTRLGCLHAPIRLTDVQPLPEALLINEFPEGFCAEEVERSFGEHYLSLAIDKVLRRAAERSYVKRQNEHIKNTPIGMLIEDGTVGYGNARKVLEDKRFVDREVAKADTKPDLDGVETLVFEEYAPDPTNPLKYLPTSRLPPTTVKITGLPGRIDIKLKHTYLYSYQPGLGKSFLFMDFKEKYAAEFVSDPNNWSAVSERAQFLIFDEVGVQKKLSFLDIKALTGGAAEGFAGNRKSHGDSHRPRRDTQVVILSNVSPYEVWGRWDAKFGRRFMSLDQQAQLLQRFNVVRLDGSADDDRMLSTAPADWTPDEYEARFAEATTRVALPSTSPCLFDAVEATVADLKRLRDLFYTYHAPRAASSAITRLCFAEAILGQRPDIEKKPLVKIIMSLFQYTELATLRGAAYRQGVEKVARSLDEMAEGTYDSDDDLPPHKRRKIGARVEESVAPILNPGYFEQVLSAAVSDSAFFSRLICHYRERASERRIANDDADETIDKNLVCDAHGVDETAFAEAGISCESYLDAVHLYDRCGSYLPLEKGGFSERVHRMVDLLR